MSETPVTEAQIQAFVDDRLTPEREAAVAAWLAQHEGEADRVRAYREQRDALRAGLAPVLDEPLPAALDLRLRGAASARSPAFARPAVAAAAAVLLMLGGAGGWALRGLDMPPTVGTAALAREAAASYMVYANDPARPVELAADQGAALDGWLSSRLARPVQAPDLSKAGLQLIGGRLVPTEFGPAGLYLYRDEAGQRVALYVRPMKVDGTHRMTRREESGVPGWTWSDDGLGFGVFGAAPADDLHATADMVRAQYRAT